MNTHTHIDAYNTVHYIIHYIIHYIMHYIIHIYIYIYITLQYITWCSTLYTHIYIYYIMHYIMHNIIHNIIHYSRLRITSYNYIVHYIILSYGPWFAHWHFTSSFFPVFFVFSLDEIWWVNSKFQTMPYLSFTGDWVASTVCIIYTIHYTLHITHYTLHITLRYVTLHYTYTHMHMDTLTRA